MIIIVRDNIVVLNVDCVKVVQNVLSGGGRIKVGRPGRNMLVANNSIDFVNDNAITVVDVSNKNSNLCISDCLTESVNIVGNRIVNPVSSGIFFGADGEQNDAPEMELREIKIEGNTISGFFRKGIKGIFPATRENVRITENTIINSRESQLGKGAVEGIQVIRGDSPVTSAQSIKIDGNEIIAKGQYATLTQGGILFEGNMNALVVADNKIKCDEEVGCKDIQGGIRSRLGDFNDVKLEGNSVLGAGPALSLGHAETLPVKFNLTNAVVLDNEFLDSTTTGVHILLPFQDEKVQARIESNRIEGSAGPAIECEGTGSFLLGILDNDFANNRGEDIVGCP